MTSSTYFKTHIIYIVAIIGVLIVLSVLFSGSDSNVRENITTSSTVSDNSPEPSLPETGRLMPGFAVLNVTSSGAPIVSMFRVSGPADIAGITSYTRIYTSGISAVLRAPDPANAANPLVFSSWTGCDAVGGVGNRDCTVSVDTGTTRNVTANYVSPPGQIATLNVNSAGAPNVSIFAISGPANIWGITSYVRSYSSNISAVLQAPSPANAANPLVFSSWTGCDSVGGTGNRQCTISVNTGTTKTVTANYVAPPGQTATLEVNSSGAPIVSVFRVSGPADIAGITRYWRSYSSNISAVLRAPNPANAANPYVFSSWTGCDSVGGTGNRDCAISVNTGATKTVTANYVAP